MKEFTLPLELRTETGKKAAKSIRREGFIPSVIYGRSEQSQAAKVPYKEFFKLASSAQSSQVFMFQSGNSSLNGRVALVKDVQQDFLSGKVLHVDFQVLHENEEVHVNVPLHIVGEAPGVKLESGIMTIVHHELSVSCLPKNIPSMIEVDISGLHLGQSLHVSDLVLPEGVEHQISPEETIVSIVAPRAVRAGEEEGGAAEAGAAAEGAEGAGAAPAKPEKA